MGEQSPAVAAPLVVEVDCRITSPNRLMREHFQTRARRRRGEIDATRNALRALVRPPLPTAGGRPIVVEFTRLGSRLCDDDNLAAAFKAPRDEVAAWLGVDDAPNDGRVLWRYRQERRLECQTDRRGKRLWRVWFRIVIVTDVRRCEPCGAILETWR